MTVLATGCMVLLLTACGDDPVGFVAYSAPCAPLLSGGYQELDADTVTTTGDVRYIDIETGEGNVAAAGDEAHVNYAVYAPDGEFLENSCANNSSVIPVFLGVPGGTIEGFKIGITGMREGGIRRVLVPEELAYNEGDLIFDIQLVDLR